MPGDDSTDSALPWSEFFAHARHNRRAALRAGGLVVAVCLVIAALLPPSYQATATLAVLPSPEFTVRAAAGSHELNASALAMDQIMKAETEILSSDDLHWATLHRMGPAMLYPDVFAPTPRGLLRRLLHGAAGALLSPWRVPPADQEAARQERGLRRFRSDLSVLPAKDANVIAVTFDADSGVNAAGALNQMLALYAARRSRLYDDPQLEVVRREAEDGARAVAQEDGRLAAFKHDHAISDYDTERDMRLRRRSQAEQSVQDADTAIDEHRARLDALAAALRTEHPTIGMYSEQDADTRLLAVNAALEGVQARIATAREKYRETSRLMTGLQAELAAQLREEARLRHDATLSVVREGRNPSIDPLRLDVARETAELAAARARRAAEQASADMLSRSIATLDQDAAAMAALQRQRASAEENYRTASRILAERHLSEAEDARRLANVRVIQQAAIPQTPRPIPLLLITAGALFGSFTSAGWLVAAYLRRPVFLTAQGLEAATGLPVLAVFEVEPELTMA